MFKKVEERRESEILRKEGMSLSEIAVLLNVSKGSVSTWVRNVKIPEAKKRQMIERYKNKSVQGSLIAGSANKEKFRTIRDKHQQEGKRLAELNDPMFFSGCMLYWAEGSKYRNCLTFTNSDVNMLRFFLRFLFKYFDIKYEDISISCHYYSSNGLNNLEVEKYWIEALEFPESCLRKTTVNKVIRTSCQKRQDRTKYGVIKIIVSNVRVIQMIYGAIQEIASFSNKEWLG